MTPAPLRADWTYPTAIRFGAGRVAEIGAACAAAGISRPLLVTDRGLAHLPITARMLDLMEDAGLGRAIFAEVTPNPGPEDLAAGLAAYAEGGHDGVIAFGGGSGIDLGKMVAFMSGQTRPVWDFADAGDNWRRADPAGIAPSVAVPTTAGTGSEVGRASVLTNPETRSKTILFHPRVLPAQVICDPELTLGMPPPITAGTGMDAFAHCLEAYCAPGFHPMAAGIALEGMRLVRDHLPRAHADGSDLEARAQMMAAALMGAVAFQRGLGAIHAISHPVGALYGTHHGTTNAVVMPAVLRFNRPAVEAPLARAADYLGLRGGYAGLYELVLGLNTELGMPEGLAALGVTPDAIPEIAALALRDPSAAGNPISLTAKALEALIADAL